MLAKVTITRTEGQITELKKIATWKAGPVSVIYVEFFLLTEQGVLKETYSVTLDDKKESSR